MNNFQEGDMTHTTTTAERLIKSFPPQILDDLPFVTAKTGDLLAFIENEKRIIREEEKKALIVHMLTNCGFRPDEISKLLSQEDTKKQDNNN